MKVLYTMAITANEIIATDTGSEDFFSDLGEGIPVFNRDKFEIQMDLLDIQSIGSNIVELHYKVLKPSTI